MKKRRGAGERETDRKSLLQDLLSDLMFFYRDDCFFNNNTFKGSFSLKGYRPNFCGLFKPRIKVIKSITTTNSNSQNVMATRMILQLKVSMQGHKVVLLKILVSYSFKFSSFLGFA